MMCFHPSYLFVLRLYLGGVHHSYDALRGPFCVADPRRYSTRVYGRHQGLPTHRLQEAQQSGG